MRPWPKQSRRGRYQRFTTGEREPRRMKRVPVSVGRFADMPQATSHPRELTERDLAVLARLTPEARRPCEIGAGLGLTNEQIGNILRKLSARGLALRSNGGWMAE